MTAIYGTTTHDTDEIVTLRDEINSLEAAFDASRWAHIAEQRARMDRYDQLMAARRPTYPTAEHLAGLDRVAAIVHNGTPYGTHHGWPTDDDKASGFELPRSVQFSSKIGRINIYALAPYRSRSTTRAWMFSTDEIEALRSELKKRSLRIATEWQHEDGVAFIVADGRV